LNKRLFLNLTPCVPLSFSRRGGEKKEGGEAPLLKLLPPSLNKGRGIKGDRF
jgi:hypothetical protein